MFDTITQWQRHIYILNCICVLSPRNHLLQWFHVKLHMCLCWFENEYCTMLHPESSGVMMTTMSHFTFQHLHMSGNLLSWVRKKQKPVVHHRILLPRVHPADRCLALQLWLWSFPTFVSTPPAFAEKAMTLRMRGGVLVCSRKRKFTSSISIGNHILHAYSMSNYVLSFFTYSNYEK